MVPIMIFMTKFQMCYIFVAKYLLLLRLVVKLPSFCCLVISLMLLNIVSGSEANMTTLCEMEFFDFLWLILVHYLPLPPTQKDRPPRPPQLPPGWGPNLGALHKTKSAPQIAIFLKLASQVGFDPKFNISQIQNLPTRSRSKNWTLEVQKIPKLKFFKFFDQGQISYVKMTTF